MKPAGQQTDADDCIYLETCVYCGEPILDDEQIVYDEEEESYHKDCALRVGV